MSYIVVNSKNDIKNNPKITPVTITEIEYQGRTYSCIGEETTKRYKCPKIIFGIFLVVISLGFSLLIKQVRSLFNPKKITIKYLVENKSPEVPTENKNQKIEDKLESKPPSKVEVEPPIVKAEDSPKTLEEQPTKTEKIEPSPNIDTRVNNAAAPVIQPKPQVPVQNVKYEQNSTFLKKEEIPSLLNLSNEPHLPKLEENEIKRLFPDVNFQHVTIKEYISGNVQITKDGSEKNNLSLVNQWIEELDKTVQLKSRLQYLEKRIEFCDLFKGWAELKTKLLFEEEIQQLKFKDIGDIPTKYITGWVSKNKNKRDRINQSEINEQNIANLSIFDIPQLKAETINKFHRILPPQIFARISQSEIPKLEVDKFSKKQLDSLCQLLCFLEVDQINLVINKINPKLFSTIGESQIKKLDFTKVTKDIFKVIFEYFSRDSILVKINQVKAGLKNLASFRELTSGQIQIIAQHFDRVHWQYLTETQIRFFDEDFLENNFEQIFTMGEESKKAFEKLEPELFKKLTVKFKSYHWERITDEQFKHLDLTKLKKDEFNLIFDLSKKERQNLLRKLDKNEISILHKYFTSNIWTWLEIEQLSSLDFSIIKANFKDIFNERQNARLSFIQTFNRQSLLELKSQFQKHHWRSLHETQIFAIIQDLSKDELSTMMSKTNYFDWIAKLTNQITIIQKNLEIQYFKHLQPLQFQYLDFSLLEENQFKSLNFGNYNRNINHLNFEQINIAEAKGYLKPEHWSAFNIDKIKLFSLDTIEKQFAFLFHQNKKDSLDYLKTFSKEWISKLKYKFEKHHWAALDRNQIFEFDFENMSKEEFHNLLQAENGVWLKELDPEKRKHIDKYLT